MHLILNSFGTSLQTQNRQFVVFSTEGKDVLNPVNIKSISISKGAKISSDAVLLAIEHEIDLMFVDSGGQPKGRVWSIAYGSIATIRKHQLAFTYSTEAVTWIKQLLRHKMDTQVALLLTFESQAPQSGRVIQRAINALEDHKQKIAGVQGEIVADVAPTLRGWEGAASRRYFEALNELLPENYKFQRRSKHPAFDAFNALLNYGYGMLYGKVEGALIKAGIDPYVGVMHRDDYNRPVLVFDMIEQYRVWIDYVVIHLCRQDIFSEDCFAENNGAIWLEGLGKRILIQAVNDYLAEVVAIKGLNRTRLVHLQNDAHQLATFFKSFNPGTL
jgi:CRISP-associated protein Cas1